MHDEAAAAAFPAAAACLETCRERLSLAARTGAPEGGLRAALALGEGRADADADAESVSIKLQYNEGKGGCFPIHYDNPGGNSRRALTVLCYLNDEWATHPGPIDTDGAADGGELVLLPFLSPESFAFQPVMGLVVVFRSDTILHYTRPCYRKRKLITIWMDGKYVNDAEDMKISVRPGESAEAEGARLARSPAQRLCSRAVYTELYERTLLDCLQGSDEADEVAKIHTEAVSQIRASSAPLARLIDRLRFAFGDSIKSNKMVHVQKV